MLTEILRFHNESERNLTLSRENRWTLGDLIRKGRFSPGFRSDYLLPIGAAIWSTPEKRMEDFPAEAFLQFFINHKLLQVNDRPDWRTIKDGSVHYVNAVAAKLPFVHLGAAVQTAERKDGKVILNVGGESRTFDKVVFATHAPITRKILKIDSDKERAVLESFATNSNRTLLHTDASFMPERKKCWSSWNVVSSANDEAGKNVSLTYYMNKLQPLQTEKNYFVTLNPRKDVQGVLREFDYHHPQFDQAAIDAQKELPSIQGIGGIYYAGAWTRYGFHEDGLLSAVNVAEALGVRPPWTIA